jgi:hypothetical protein
VKDEGLESQAVDVEGPRPPDPRETLATWANEQDEWVRSIVRRVLGTGRALSSDDVDDVYALFRQEKGLDERTLPTEPGLTAEVSEEAGKVERNVARPWRVSTSLPRFCLRENKRYWRLPISLLRLAWRGSQHRSSSMILSPAWIIGALTRLPVGWRILPNTIR